MKAYKKINSAAGHCCSSDSRKNKNLFTKNPVKLCCLLFLISFPVFAQQDIEASRMDTIRYGTDSEITALIQSLRTENTDYLDNELIKIVQASRNQGVLTGVFAFFGEREKSGLEDRAIKAITERQNETNETVLSAMDYLGRVKSGDAVSIIMEVLETEERRFLSTGFRAIGRASSANKELADDTADFLVDFYTYREPGNDNQSVIISAIGDTGSSIGVPFLVDLVTNTDERIPLRVAALGALSRIGDDEGLEAILSCIGTNDPNVRSAAVAALGPFTGDNVDSAILEAFRDSYYRARIAAAQASRDRKLEAAVPFLRYRAERDDVPNVKDEAIRALGAIANKEAVEVLEILFYERKNSDRVRILAGDMLMKNSPEGNFLKAIIELDEAKKKNQTPLYNGILKIIGETVTKSETADAENLARRFMQSGTPVEKMYGLDLAANNNLGALREEIITLTKERNESIKRRAVRTAEKLGIELSE
ncbi:MAG: HEAT repeat domain-containing protein [Treponema sp.]|nr:HEAT repeat domain-containing protein [Treponema sp.]